VSNDWMSDIEIADLKAQIDNLNKILFSSNPALWQKEATAQIENNMLILIDNVALEIDRFNQLVASEYKLPVKYKAIADTHIENVISILEEYHNKES